MPPTTLTRASLLAGSLWFAINALGQWPGDARIVTRRVDRRTDQKTVTIVRKCADLDDAILEFSFEYPQFRGKSAAIGKVNRAIETSFSTNDELLQGCAETAPGPRGESSDSVEWQCEVSSHHAALVTVRCRYAANVLHKSNGFVSFMTFDMTTGHKLKTSDLVSRLPEFTEAVRAQLIAGFPEEPGGTRGDDEFVDEVIARLLDSCGLTEQSVVCTALVGTHNYYEVRIPIRRVCNLMAPHYFASACRRHNRWTL